MLNISDSLLAFLHTEQPFKMEAQQLSLHGALNGGLSLRNTFSLTDGGQTVSSYCSASQISLTDGQIYCKRVIHVCYPLSLQVLMVCIDVSLNAIQPL